MKIRGQGSGVRSQGSGVRNPTSIHESQVFHPVTCHSSLAPLHSRKRGFTLTELLLAMSISILVFGAMGALLGRCFRMWTEATAQWRIAQVAQISRQRILRGGFNDPSSGLLSATNVAVAVDGHWDYVQYNNSSGGVRRIYGWSGVADQDMYLYQSPGSPMLVYAQNSGLSQQPNIKVDSFDAEKTNNFVIINCRFRFDAGGKAFAQQHTIRTYLVNEEEEE